MKPQILITRIALLLGMAVAIASGATPQSKLTVYIETGNADHHNIIPLARHLAGRMFAEIGVNVEWKTGQPVDESSPPPILIEIIPESPDNLRPGVLAYARPYEGTSVTVFLDRIEGSHYPAFLLAHVFVHEITHVVQGVARHSDSGVMKAQWTAHDYDEMRFKPFPFTTEDIDLINKGLVVRHGMTYRLAATRWARHR